MIQFGQADSDAVEYWTINTDIQALDASLSPNRLGLGAGTSRGLGAGGNPEMGALAAEESYEQIAQMVSGSDMVFVVGGMCAPAALPAARSRARGTARARSRPSGSPAPCRTRAAAARLGLARRRR
eukprot:6904566-Prymnesium_polylepis.2